MLGAGALAVALSATGAVGPAAAADTVTDTISVGAYPSSVAISPDGGRAYVTNQLSDAVSVIDVATNAFVGAPIAVGGNPVGVAFAPDGERAYVTNNSSSVSVIDVANNAVVGDPIAVGTNPVAVAITPDRERAYVANIFGSSVSVIAIEVAPTLTGAPPAGVLGQYYSHAFTTAGQPAPTVAVTAGALPAGLALTEAGVLSGTPTAAGSFTFTVTVSNGIGEPAVLPVTLVVTDSTPPSTGSLGSLEGFGS